MVERSRHAKAQPSPPYVLPRRHGQRLRQLPHLQPHSESPLVQGLPRTLEQQDARPHRRSPVSRLHRRLLPRAVALGQIRTPNRNHVWQSDHDCWIPWTDPHWISERFSGYAADRRVRRHL
jgi:hypothetical protein